MTRDIDFAEIRPERIEDAPAVRALLLEAFDTPAEADLVEALRAGDDIALGLVAVAQDGLAGFVAFSRARLDGRPALALAPVAVSRDRRIEGVGSRLVRAGLRALEGAFVGQVVVLGDPLWYDRFGFLPAPDPVNRWAGPHMMALAVGAAEPARGTLVYPSAFDAL